MRLIEDLCPPAFLFLLYVVVHIAMDLSLGMYMTAGVKLVAGIVQIFLLNAFCKVDLGLVSWVIIATPFLVMALATSIAMGLQMDKGMTLMVKEHFASPKKDAKIEVLGPGEPPEQSNSII
jgi:hypothetical protein